MHPPVALNHLYDVQGHRARHHGRFDRYAHGLQDHGTTRLSGQSRIKVNERKIRHRRVTNDHLVSDPAMPVNLADPDVAALVQKLINMANDLARARLRRDENHLGAHPSLLERRMLMPGRSRSSVPILFRRAGAFRMLFALA